LLDSLLQEILNMKGSKSIAKPPVQSCGKHELEDEQISSFRTDLLSWYTDKSRKLPWREIAKNEQDDNIRGYSVLVSEIMLQQTQVATVIDYYNKWMKKWPSTSHLNKATLDEVNQAWSGLGYYSRGRRLLEAAQLIERDLNGVMPRTAAALMKLPGVGRYTASAVASIAYGQVVGLVDGNVLRVLSRLRYVGAEISSTSVTDWMWTTAENIVDPANPGDFNQAMMELGATVCTPKSPNCSSCPLRDLCLARTLNHETIKDIEDTCQLCIKPDKFDLALGVTNFPQKTKKTASREETTLVLALTKGSGARSMFAVQQRPSSGLLASLWELITVEFKGESEREQTVAVQEFLQDRKLLFKGLERKGEVSHIFSHINMKYVVFSAQSQGENCLEFVTAADFLVKGTSTAMKKVVKFLENKPESKKRKGEPLPKSSKQKSIGDYFKAA